MTTIVIMNIGTTNDDYSCHGHIMDINAMSFNDTEHNMFSE